MAVSPDLLLNIQTPQARQPASASKAGQAPQPSQDKGASFAQVYERQRQAKPEQRAEASARPAEREAAEREPSAAQEGVEGQALAADGKALPPAEAATEGGEDQALDAVLQLGLPEQLAALAPEQRQLPGVDFAAQPGAALPAEDVAFAASAPAGVDDALLGELMQSAERKTSLQLAATAQPVAQVAERAASVLQGAGEQLGESGDSEPEPAFGELLEAVETPNGSRTLADPSLNRLHPLAQAIGTQGLQPQQAQQPQPVLAQVPGQPVPFQQAGWSEAVVDRVMWMSSQNLKSAEIQLDPAELGRMEVRIEMTKDQAQVTFLSAHAGVRDQLEGQMQRLRDMFAQQGMSMDVNVSDQSQTRGWQGQGQEGDGSRGRSSGSAAAEEVASGTMEIGSDRSTGDRGLVDYYA